MGVGNQDKLDVSAIVFELWYEAGWRPSVR